MPTKSGHTSVIRARKVIGTEVKTTAGETIGEVEDVALDKLSNNIMFAIVSAGGFLGMGEKYHPIPWSALRYAEDQGAYVLDASREKLMKAPADSLEALTRDDGHAFRDRAFKYYDGPNYW